MTTSSKTDLPDFTSLAAEACDLWQEHLSTYAQNPEAKAAMIKMMEPQRQIFSGLFADYATMVQNARHGAAPTSSSQPGSAGPDRSTSGTQTPGGAPDDIALRLAQLAHRVAYLEKHCAELEQRLGRSEHRRNNSAAETKDTSEQG